VIKQKTLWAATAAVTLSAVAQVSGAAPANSAPNRDSVIGVATTDDNADTFDIDAVAGRNGHTEGTVYGQEGDIAAGGPAVPAHGQLPRRPERSPLRRSCGPCGGDRTRPPGPGPGRARAAYGPQHTLFCR